MTATTPTTPPIISSHGHYDVLAERHLIHWPDGTAVELHPVQVHGLAHTYLRAVRHVARHWLVFDLRKLLPQLEEDICALPERDHRGAVLLHLRAQFTTADKFLVATLDAEVRAAIWSAPHDDDWLPPAHMLAATSAQQAVAA